MRKCPLVLPPFAWTEFPPSPTALAFGRRRDGKLDRGCGDSGRGGRRWVSTIPGAKGTILAPVV
jgi:hypothetical protein